MPDTLVLPPTIGLSFGSSLQSQARVLRAGFGSNYVQRQGDGLNPISRKYSVQFVNLLRVEAQEIEDFFTAHGGWQSFYFTIPGQDDPTLWICSDWTRSHVDRMIDTISASWEEVFVP